MYSKNCADCFKNENCSKYIKNKRLKEYFQNIDYWSYKGLKYVVNLETREMAIQRRDEGEKFHKDIVEATWGQVDDHLIRGAGIMTFVDSDCIEIKFYGESQVYKKDHDIAIDIAKKTLAELGITNYIISIEDI